MIELGVLIIRYIATLRSRANPLYYLRVTKQVVKLSVYTPDNTNSNHSPAQSRRLRTTFLTFLHYFDVMSHDKTHRVSSMLLDLTADTPINSTSHVPVSTSVPSASSTALRNRRRNLTTLATDDNASIDSMLHDGPLDIRNNLKHSWIPSVI